MIVLHHPEFGVYSLYAHLEQVPELQLHQRVHTTRSIGAEGTTGALTDPCTNEATVRHRLHLSIWQRVTVELNPAEGKYIGLRLHGVIDPEEFMPSRDTWGDPVLFLACPEN